MLVGAVLAFYLFGLQHYLSWDYLRGKRPEAMRRLENFARTTQAREIAGLADCTLTIWLLEAGDRAGAAKRNACRFLADPNGANFPTPAAHAYALLLAKDFLHFGNCLGR